MNIIPRFIDSLISRSFNLAHEVQHQLVQLCTKPPTIKRQHHSMEFALIKRPIKKLKPYSSQFHLCMLRTFVRNPPVLEPETRRPRLQMRLRWNLAHGNWQNAQLGQGDQLRRQEIPSQQFIQIPRVIPRRRGKLTLTDQAIKCLLKRIKLQKKLKEFQAIMMLDDDFFQYMDLSWIGEQSGSRLKEVTGKFQ